VLRFASISAFLSIVRSCAPTDPGTFPGRPTATTTTTTLPPCCRTDIYHNSNPKTSLFDPVLTDCPHDTNFICATTMMPSTKTTTIVINGKETIATGMNGANCFAMITCNDQKVMTSLIVFSHGAMKVQSVLRFASISSLFGTIQPCAPTDPGTKP
ncbi:hypothetical protein PMAYCL1PPCAC_13443, partial [Pristionchus mayeri]